MTIRQIANRIIKEIKAWPEEAKQSQDIGSPKTSWDEYKEQIQYEEYDSFEVFEETIESMVRDEVNDLSLVVIEKMYRSTFIDPPPATFEERRKDIICLALSYIKSEAETQDIKYNKPEIDFVRYYIDDLTIVAKVLSKVGPEEYLIQGYSEATGLGGEQGVANLSVLEDENGLERISAEEFARVKKSFKAEFESSKQINDISQTEIIQRQNKNRQKCPEEKVGSNDNTKLQDTQENSKGSTGRNEVRDEGEREKTGQAELKNDPLHTPEVEAMIVRLKAAFENLDSNANPSALYREVSLAEYNEARGAIITKLELLSPGYYPKLAVDGMTLARYYIESGAKNFPDYIIAMEADIGPDIKPYLKQFYSGVRFEPGFDATGMTSHDDVMKADVETLIDGIKEEKTKSILEIATERLTSLGEKIYKAVPVIPQLMELILDRATPEELDNMYLSKYNLEQVTDLVQVLLTASNKVTLTLLSLTNSDYEREIVQLLEKATTIPQIRSVLIEKLLVRAMMETEGRSHNH